MRLCLFIEDDMGFMILKYLTSNYPDHVCHVVIRKEMESVYSDRMSSGYTWETYDDETTPKNIKSLDVDFVLLAWWPKIVSALVIESVKIGVINLHPSMLPFNRGKHYWFWNLVEDKPYGVSIHFVDTSIDGGDIIFQREIPKSWEDTGQSLFDKARIEMLSLFIESYPKIANLDYTRIKQPPSGTYHNSSELHRASEISLRKKYTAKELLNLLRARVSKKYEQCYFFDEDGTKYEVGIDIKKVED